LLSIVRFLRLPKEQPDYPLGNLLFRLPADVPDFGANGVSGLFSTGGGTQDANSDSNPDSDQKSQGIAQGVIVFPANGPGGTVESLGRLPVGSSRPIRQFIHAGRNAIAYIAVCLVQNTEPGF
jgi:hypothetical protein